MSNKGIAKIVLSLFCFVFLFVIYALGLKGILISIIATLLMLILSVEAGIMAVKGKSKELFRIFGGIAAWFSVCLIWYWILWQMGCSELIYKLSFFLNGFWALNLLLLVILSFLGKTRLIDIFVKTIVFGSAAIILFTCLSFFSETLARQRHQVVSQLMKGISVSAVQNIREKHTIRETDSFLKSLEELQEIAKTRPLSKEELKKVDEMEAGLARIYSKPEGKKGEKGKKEYVFQVKPGEVTHTGIFPEKGMVYNFLTDGICWFVNGSGKNILIKKSHSIRIDTSQNFDNPREIQLRGYKTPVQVSVKRVL